jgi:Fe-Mn family superoxide dismutase
MIMTYAMKPLSFNPSELRGLSEKLVVSHYENNYGGAVKRLNSIEETMAELDFTSAPVFTINGLKREQLIAMNSMILHELYFAGLGASDMPKAVRDVLARDFGSADRWQSEFVAMGKAQGGGSGWVLLTYSHRDGKLVNQWAADHTCCVAGATPVLALDMYEHAYHIDYRAAAAKYVDAFMQNVHWEDVDRRFCAAQRTAVAFQGG